MQPLVEIIDRDPEFHALQRARSRFALGLLATVLVAFYCLIGAIAFAPTWLAQSISVGTHVTIGIVGVAVVMALALGLIGWYVWRANHEFDRKNIEILARARRATNP
jgi:uncharacterized membrane protein (DUF485 family)